MFLNLASSINFFELWSIIRARDLCALSIKITKWIFRGEPGVIGWFLTQTNLRNSVIVHFRRKITRKCRDSCHNGRNSRSYVQLLDITSCGCQRGTIIRPIIAQWPPQNRQCAALTRHRWSAATFLSLVYLALLINSSQLWNIAAVKKPASCTDFIARASVVTRSVPTRGKISF